MNIASIEPRLRVNDFAGEVLASSNLVPEVTGELKPDEAVDQLAVFLFPKDRYAESTRFEFAMGGLKLTNGQSWFSDQWLLFDIWNS